MLFTRKISRLGAIAASLGVMIAAVSAGAQTPTPVRGQEVIRLAAPHAVQLAWSHDLSRFAALTGEQITVWDTGNWHRLYTIPDADAYALAWHPTENVIAAVQGGRQERLVLWDGETGAVQRQIVRPLPAEVRGIVVVHALAWSPDGHQIVSDDAVDTLGRWDLEAGTYTPFVPPLEQSPQHAAIDLAWSPDGQYLLSGGLDGTLHVWNAGDGTNHLTIEGYKYVAWSPDGATFAGASFDAAITLWRLADGQVESSLTQPTATITSIDWNTAENCLALTDADGRLLLWDFATNTVLPLDLRENSQIKTARWRPDGRQLAVSSNEEIIIVDWSPP